MSDNSQVTERGIVGIFFDAMEGALGDSWASQVSLEIPSDAESMTHAWLGQSPQMREWVGGVILKAIRNKTLTVVNKLYEGTTSVNVDDLRRDKTGRLRTKAADELGATSAEHWEELFTDLIDSDNPTCYDKQSFFDTDHPIDESGGTQKNRLTSTEVPALAVAATGAITKTEAAAIIIGLVQHFYSLKTDRDRPANGQARAFMLMTPVAHYGAFIQAAADLLTSDGGTNALVNQKFRVEVVVNPFLSVATKVFMFRTDARGSRPFIRQVETEPELTIIDDTREKVMHRREVYHVESWRAAAPGQYREALEGTLD